MNNFFNSMISNYFVLIFLVAVIGVYIGRLRLGQFRLGLSGALFAGLIVGWVVASHFPALKDSRIVPKDIFYLFLILFVAAVGLLAAKDMGTVMRKYGLRFMILGVVITISGALATYVASTLNVGQSPFAMAGVYVGALTSSPGLGAALESVAAYGATAESAVGTGYAIAYPFGVLIVILAVQFMAPLLKIDISLEKEKLRSEIPSGDDQAKSNEQFDILAFSFVCLLGYLIGKIAIPMGKLGDFMLGSTGGVLLTALLLGSMRRLGPFKFTMPKTVLSAIRELSLTFFLAIVGLRYGYDFMAALTGPGLVLAMTALVCGLVAIIIGFLVGYYVLKINWILLLGAVCGGMTSTPGLGAALSVTDEDLTAAGYGATYPVALFCMVIFTIMLTTFA